MAGHCYVHVVSIARSFLLGPAVFMLTDRCTVDTPSSLSPPLTTQ